MIDVATYGPAQLCIPKFKSMVFWLLPMICCYARVLSDTPCVDVSWNSFDEKIFAVFFPQAHL